MLMTGYANQRERHDLGALVIAKPSAVDQIRARYVRCWHSGNSGAIAQTHCWKSEILQQPLDVVKFELRPGTLAEALA
jgi:hypothetical protein